MGSHKTKSQSGHRPNGGCFASKTSTTGSEDLPRCHEFPGKSPVSVEIWRQCLRLHEKSWIYIYIYYIHIYIYIFIYIYKCGIPLHSVHKTGQNSTSRKRYGLVHCKNSKWLYSHSSLTLSCFIELTLSNWLNRESHTRYSILVDSPPKLWN